MILQDIEVFPDDLISHDVPVNVVLYNKLFHQVVSGGSDSLVCVWDVNSGDMVIQFSASKVGL